MFSGRLTARGMSKALYVAVRPFFSDTQTLISLSKRTILHIVLKFPFDRTCCQSGEASANFSLCENWMKRRRRNEALVLTSGCLRLQLRHYNENDFRWLKYRYGLISVCLFSGVTVTVDWFCYLLAQCVTWRVNTCSQHARLARGRRLSVVVVIAWYTHVAVLSSCCRVSLRVCSCQ